jgi:hypothetical protein
LDVSDGVGTGERDVTDAIEADELARILLRSFKVTLLFTDGSGESVREGVVAGIDGAGDMLQGH